MNSLPKIDIMEATRLTREGRLQEAMAVLRGGAGQESRPAAGAAEAQPGTGFLSRLRRLAHAPTSQGGPRPAPEPMPGGARFLAKSFTNAAGTRAYKVYIPSSYTGDPVPLVVMLHGCTQSADDFAAGTRMNVLAEDMRFIVVYPEQSKAANPSKCWNWFNPADQRRDAGEPSIIAGVTRQVMRDYAVEPTQVYAAGLSAGGAKAAILGVAYPDLYAAIGVHSGLAGGSARDVPTAFAAMRKGGAPGARQPGDRSQPAPAIVFHGDRDATVHPSNGEHVISQARPSEPHAGELSVEVRTGSSPGGVGFTQTIHAAADGRSLLEHWTLHGSGHAWSGGSPAGTYTDPKGPDASREMMRFFLQHRASGSGPAR
ncbi:extracellular catalytic domain type 1 short-chain-length polyhydroxyalkanoate depolymerase [Alsobacter sp. SYSU BS001988]